MKTHTRHRWWATGIAALAALALVVVALLATSTTPKTAKADDRGFTMTAKELKSEKRVALVIGNGAYKTGRLANPINDAQAMGRQLKALGFEVMVHTNLDQNAMKRAIIDFGRKLRGSGGVGLFYYAGHGMQVGGRNYLIPVGAQIEGESYVDVEAVDIARVMAAMGEARNRLNIVVLDACRDNPFARSTRSTSRGLAFSSAPRGTLIAYATAPGRVAADGKRGNGTYTEALLKHMKTPGLPVEEMFKRVRADVMSESGGKQTPWESSSLTGRFEFNVSDKPAVTGTVVCPSGSTLVGGRCVAKVVCPAGMTFAEGRGCVPNQTRGAGGSLSPTQLAKLWGEACRADGAPVFYTPKTKALPRGDLLDESSMGMWSLGGALPGMLTAYLDASGTGRGGLKLNNHAIYDSLQILAKLSGVEASRNGYKHPGTPGWFMQVNPSFIPWVEGLLPRANQRVCGNLTAQAMYDKVFKPGTRAFASAWLHLKAQRVDSWFKGGERDTYFKHVFNPAHRAGKTCDDYAGAITRKPLYGFQASWDDVPFQACHFWLRRTVDGSRGKLVHLVAKVLKTYDKGYYARYGRQLR